MSRDSPAPATGPGPGLVISTTPPILSFLVSASTDPHLSKDLQQTASKLSSKSNVPYRAIRALWVASRASTRPQLVKLFSGSGFVFTSPKPREKSEELKARLKELAEMSERNAYAELVKDITPRKDSAPEPFSSYKDQLGFGLHVVVTMFTGYLVGYAAFRALFSHSPVMNAAGGILGLVIGMLVETLIFIIQASRYDLKSSSSTSKLKKDQ
ncbi:putative ATPase, vacuolar ER assembly factor, Vma12 [Rosa chinensis]|uniref:Putative ATPase, vacuolar ER assembly factor, Vma12 n=1 Tax=Rosa chinensis TaxID=74649 RepID=A0A2P6PA47_ROSCH|nr:uncharacterized protein LOC112179517 [Rosa chinensis]XP_024173719.1 uncharacterized protein LOC112179517 [Rosa chinensis]XP_040368055.1 uncharacterized protein LOC112179517 [Rosa chinensis]PRQ18811.1 putative ATPase, vacuolar ER assembly factor, Vma12 [Rosa chinensis]